MFDHAKKYSSLNSNQKHIVDAFIQSQFQKENQTADSIMADLSVLPTHLQDIAQDCYAKALLFEADKLLRS